MSPSVNHTSLRGAAVSKSVGSSEIDSAVCYVLDSNLNIAYVNPAWDNFARDNDGSQLTVKACDLYEHLPSDP